MATITLKDAQAQLPDLIARLRPYESVVIMQDGEPVAYLSPTPTPRKVPKFGSCRDLLTVVADDDEHLADLADSMPRSCYSRPTPGCGLCSRTSTSPPQSERRAVV